MGVLRRPIPDRLVAPRRKAVRLDWMDRVLRSLRPPPFALRIAPCSPPWLRHRRPAKDVPAVAIAPCPFYRTPFQRSLARMELPGSAGSYLMLVAMPGMQRTGSRLAPSWLMSWEASYSTPQTS